MRRAELLTTCDTDFRGRFFGFFFFRPRRPAGLPTGPNAGLVGPQPLRPHPARDDDALHQADQGRHVPLDHVADVVRKRFLILPRRPRWRLPLRNFAALTAPRHRSHL